MGLHGEAYKGGSNCLRLSMMLAMLLCGESAEKPDEATLLVATILWASALTDVPNEAMATASPTPG